MNDDRLRWLLGQTHERDPGCEACFAELDRYAEAHLAGEPVEKRFPQIVAHLSDCPACREDADSLLEALRRPENSDPER